MVNTISSEVVKTYHPIVTEKDTLPQKSALTTAQKVAENKVIAQKEVSATDSTKLQYFQYVKEHLKTLNYALEAAASRTEVSQDLILARQLALNSVTNMLSLMDTVALTDEEKSILEQTAQEMETILLNATGDKSVEVLLNADDKELVEVSPVATGQTMAAVLNEATEDLPAMTSSALDFSAYRTSGDNIICDKLAALLHKADKEYLQAHEYASKVRADFQEKIAQIQQIIPNHISTVTDDDNDDKGNIVVDALDIKDAILSTIDLSESYEAIEKLTLYPPNYSWTTPVGVYSEFSDTNGPLPPTPEGKAEAEYWANEIPGAKVYEWRDQYVDDVTGFPNGQYFTYGYLVVIDTQPIEDICETLKLPYWFVPGGTGVYNNSSLSPTEFQAWQTGFNSEIEGIKTTTQELSQGYNNANSIFSTLSKLLTSSIQTLYDSLTSYLRF